MFKIKLNIAGVVETADLVGVAVFAIQGAMTAHLFHLNLLAVIVLSLMPVLPSLVLSWCWSVAGSDCPTARRAFWADWPALVCACCWRRLNIDPPCRLNIDPGRVAVL